MNHSISRTGRSALHVAAVGFATALTIASCPLQAAPITLTTSDGGFDSSFNSALHWSDNAPPTAGKDYLVASNRDLRTPSTVSEATFLGDSLTLGDGTFRGSLVYKHETTIANCTITINDLRMNNGSISNAGNYGKPIIAGNITLLSGGGSFNMSHYHRSILVTAPISGSGPLTIANSDITPLDSVPAGITLSGHNIYTGSTTVNTNARLFLDSAGSTLLDINDAGNSQILGAGQVTLDGLLRLDVSDVTAGGAWTLITVSTLTETFGAHFAIALAGAPDIAFANQGGGLWTLSDGNNDWSFSQSTGVLSLVAVPEPSALCLLIAGALVMALPARSRRRA